jgi:hypothetical protein
LLSELGACLKISELDLAMYELNIVSILSVTELIVVFSGMLYIMVIVKLDKDELDSLIVL